MDGAESELGILDLIQVFVEALDRSFSNVCELDLIFHYDEVSLLPHLPPQRLKAGSIRPSGNHTGRVGARNEFERNHDLHPSWNAQSESFDGFCKSITPFFVLRREGRERRWAKEMVGCDGGVVLHCCNQYA